ncbi:MAG: hypothetical protein JG766_1183 [Desulfacinum sp.]|jgi:hypothetical protein|nr:hypothetical protein [Desulfacinum sp.]
MARPPKKALEQLLSLAKEYESKQKQLDELAARVPPRELRPSLIAMGERATDRFRTAQQILLNHLYSDETASTPGEHVREAAAAMCRSFDELVLLFHRLLDEGPASE